MKRARNEMAFNDSHITSKHTNTLKSDMITFLSGQRECEMETSKKRGELSTSNKKRNNKLQQQRQYICLWLYVLDEPNH